LIARISRSRRISTRPMKFDGAQMNARLYVAAFPSGNPVSFTSQPSRIGDHRGAQSIGKPSRCSIADRSRGESSIGDSNDFPSLPFPPSPCPWGERTSDILPYRRYGRRFGKPFGIQRALRRALKARCRNSSPRRWLEDRSRNIYCSDARGNARGNNASGILSDAGYIGTDVLM